MEVRQNGRVLVNQADRRLRARAASLVEVQRDGRQPAWTDEEDDFLRANMTKMSKARMALCLGRSVVAIGLRRRRLALPSISAQSGLAAREVGEVLGYWSGREVSRLVEAGLMPGTRTPLGNGRLNVDANQLTRWAIRPESWIHFEAQKVRVPRLRRLVELAQERWDDEWLSLREASTVAGVSVRELNRLCNEGSPTGLGRAPAIQKLGRKHRTWYLRRSDAEGLALGRRQEVWSPEAERFALLAVAVGVPKQRVDQLASWPRRRTSHRISYLAGKGRLETRARELGVPAEVRGKELFADWKRHRDRFRSLAVQMDRLEGGEKVDQEKGTLVCGVLGQWLSWFAWQDDEALDTARRIRSTVRPTGETLERYAQELARRGIDIFGKEQK